MDSDREHHLGGARRAARDSTNVALDTLWVVVAAILVMFMQAGFAFLEMGFSRQKNAGTVVAKVLTNFAICAVVFWAVGFALGFGRGRLDHRLHGFALNTDNVVKDFPGLVLLRRGDLGEVVVRVRLLRGLAGDRLGHDARADQVRRLLDLRDRLLGADLPADRPLAVLAAAGCRPSLGSQDFAGSTVVHLTGATGGLAALLLLGPRRGKYGADGKPNVIPGHSDAVRRPGHASSSGSAGSASTPARRSAP